MLLNMAIGVALARILGPEAFGLYAFVFAINELLNIVGAFSLHSALIQSRDESQELYDTALAICFGLGLLGMVAALAIAPFLWVHRGSEAAWFLLALSLSRVLRLVSQVPRARLERSMRYGTITTIQVTGGSVPNVVALGLALVGVGPWCLVVRDLLVALLTLAMEAGFSGYRFAGQVRRQPSRRLMSFARRLFLARTTDILVERVDRVVAGAYLGNAAAGLLDRSRFLADLGLLVMRPVERTSMNLFSRVQDDGYRLSRAYSLVNFFLIRMVFALAAVCLLAPSEFVRLVYGPDWLAAATPLRWLAVHAAFMPMLSIVKVLIIARARVERLVRISIWQACVLVPGALVAGHLGSLEGTAAAIAATSTVGMCLAVLATRDQVDTSYVRLALVPLAALGVTATVVFGADALGWSSSLPWWSRPFLVGTVFVLAVLAAEGSRMKVELGYLREQLGGGPTTTPPTGRG